MTQEFGGRSFETGHEPTGQEQSIQKEIGRMQARTINLDALTSSKELGKTLLRNSTAFFGHEYVSGKPLLTVVTSWLNTDNDALFAKAKTKLQRMGEYAVQNAIQMGVIGFDEVPKVEVQVVAPRQNQRVREQEFTGKVKSNAEKYAKEEGSKTSKISASKAGLTPPGIVWELPAEERPSFKKFGKASVVTIGSLALVGCTGIPVIPSHPITKEPSNTPSVTVSPTDEGPTGTATSTKEPSATPEKTYPITTDPENEAGMCRINLVKDENGALRVPESLLRFEQKNALPLIATEEELGLLDYSARQLQSTDAFVLDLNPTGINNKHIVRLFNICKTSLVPFGGKGQAYVWVYQYTNKDGTPAFVHELLSEEDHQKQIDSGRLYGNEADAFLFPVAKSPGKYWSGLEKYAAIKENIWKKQFNTVTAKEGENAAIEVAKQVGGSDTFDSVAQELIWMSGFATY